MSIDAARLRRFSPWLMLCGATLVLAGLGWDAALHRADPGLAAREGVFSASNPGHVLFAAGFVLLVAGGMLFLSAQALAERGRRALAFSGGAAALLVAAGVTFAMAVAAGGLGGPQHVHDDGSVHTHGEHQQFLAAQGKNPASSSLPGVSHAHGEAVAIAAQDLVAAAKLVSDVLAGTSRLQDFDAARAEGYVQITAGRAGLAHYLNPAYYLDGRDLDPERPEVLMYLRLPGGGQKLVGVMFLMLPGQAGPRIGGPLTAWHAHDNLCYSAGTGVIVALTGADGKCPAGTVYRGVSPEMMHVWVVDNPNGVFADEMEPAALIALLSAEAGH